MKARINMRAVKQSISGKRRFYRTRKASVAIQQDTINLAIEKRERKNEKRARDNIRSIAAKFNHCYYNPDRDKNHSCVHCQIKTMVCN